MGRTCLKTGVLHMGSHSSKKCLLKPWDTHLAFSLSNKGPQSFLLTPTRGFSLFHFYSFYKVPVPDCWSSLLFLPLINWVILGKVFLVSETSPLVWKGGIDIRTVIIIIVLILVIIGCQMVGSKCLNYEAVLEFFRTEDWKEDSWSEYLYVPTQFSPLWYQILISDFHCK